MKQLLVGTMEQELSLSVYRKKIILPNNNHAYILTWLIFSS